MTESSHPSPARHRSPYGLAEKIKRTLWSAVEATLFRCTWPTWYRYRGWMLRRFGARVHPTARVRRTVRITCPWNLSLGSGTATGDHVRFYCLGPIVIGDRVTISQHSHLCAGTHDYDHVDMPLLRLGITIHDDVWIATDAFVGPGISIGEGVLLGARACAFKNLHPWTIYGGNPARPLKDRNIPSNPHLDPPET